MTAPTKTTLSAFGFAYQAQPFVYVTGKSTIDTTLLGYPYQAQPFVAAPDASVTPPVPPVVIGFSGSYTKKHMMIRPNGLCSFSNG